MASGRNPWHFVSAYFELAYDKKTMLEGSESQCGVKLPICGSDLGRRAVRDARLGWRLMGRLLEFAAKHGVRQRRALRDGRQYEQQCGRQCNVTFAVSRGKCTISLPAIFESRPCLWWKTQIPAKNSSVDCRRPMFNVLTSFRDSCPRIPGLRVSRDFVPSHVALSCQAGKLKCCILERIGPWHRL